MNFETKVNENLTIKNVHYYTPKPVLLLDIVANSCWQVDNVAVPSIEHSPNVLFPGHVKFKADNWKDESRERTYERGGILK